MSELALTATCFIGNKAKLVLIVMLITTILVIRIVCNLINGIMTVNNAIQNVLLVVVQTLFSVSLVMIQIINFMTEGLFALKHVEMENYLVITTVMMETTFGMMGAHMIVIMNQDFHVCQEPHIHLQFAVKFVEMGDESICNVMMPM